MAVNTVIFDLGNVLVEYNWRRYLDTFLFDEKTYDIIANAMFLNEDWEEGDRGATPQEWLELFIENAPEYETEIRKVYKNLGECVCTFDYTADLIAHFREKGYRIFYLSNYSEDLVEKTKDKLAFIETFDGGVFSYKEKCIKPDKTIYKILLGRYDINSEDALFFDDRWENVEAAKELGIQGILFTSDTVKEYLE